MIKFTIKTIATSTLVLGIAATGLQLPVPETDHRVITVAIKTWNQLAKNANAYFVEHQDEIKAVVTRGGRFAVEKTASMTSQIIEYAEENKDDITANSESAVNFYFKEKIK